jgi:hypothetical protein
MDRLRGRLLGSVACSFKFTTPFEKLGRSKRKGYVMKIGNIKVIGIPKQEMTIAKWVGLAVSLFFVFAPIDTLAEADGCGRSPGHKGFLV